MKEILRLLLGTSFGEDRVCRVGTGDGIRLPSASSRECMPKRVQVYLTILILGLPVSTKEMGCCVNTLIHDLPSFFYDLKTCY